MLQRLNDQEKKSLSAMQAYALACESRRHKFPYWRQLRRGQPKQRPNRKLALHTVNQWQEVDRNGRLVTITGATWTLTEKEMRRRIERQKQGRRVY